MWLAFQVLPWHNYVTLYCSDVIVRLAPTLLAVKTELLSVVFSLFSVVTERNHQPWHNRSITEAKRRLRRLEHKQSSQCKRVRNTYSDLLYKTRANYYKSAISEAKDNSKALYRITNTLLGNTRNIVLPDYDDIVLLGEKFQFYFSSKIHRQITENNCQQHQSTEKHTSSWVPCLPLITKIDFRNIVKSLKYKSCLLDPLPAFILKDHVV